MKRMLTFLLDLFVRRARRRKDVYHNDALRANQFNDTANTFGYWRSLVS
jgi:hypothetical protein